MCIVNIELVKTKSNNCRLFCRWTLSTRSLLFSQDLDQDLRAIKSRMTKSQLILAAMLRPVKVPLETSLYKTVPENTIG